MSTDCEQFAIGSRQRQICEGFADLPLYKINRYRERWKLPPLLELPTRELNIYDVASGPVRKNHVVKSETVIYPPPPIRKPKRSSRVYANPTVVKSPTNLSIIRTPNKPELGDMVANTLKIFGITPDKVSQWLGRPCGCRLRQEKLNKLDRWARQYFGGNQTDATNNLDNLINDNE